MYVFFENCTRTLWAYISWILFYSYRCSFAFQQELSQKQEQLGTLQEQVKTLSARVAEMQQERKSGMFSQLRYSFVLGLILPCHVMYVAHSPGEQQFNEADRAMKNATTSRNELKAKLKRLADSKSDPLASFPNAKEVFLLHFVPMALSELPSIYCSLVLAFSLFLSPSLCLCLSLCTRDSVRILCRFWRICGAMSANSA